ncbi:MAG: conjugal transfer protein TraG, partial [Pedobacter sp.]
MNTGEDVQGLRKIIDFTRLLSIFILAIHFYLSCYQGFTVWGWTAGITDSIVGNIARTGLFEGLFRAKLAALLLLVISLVGVKGKKDEKILLKAILVYLGSGTLLYFAAALCFFLPSPLPSSKTLIALSYIAMTAIGYLLILTGGGQLSRLLKD